VQEVPAISEAAELPHAGAVVPSMTLTRVT
jgi:hypothetical protein